MHSLFSISVSMHHNNYYLALPIYKYTCIYHRSTSSRFSGYNIHVLSLSSPDYGTHYNTSIIHAYIDGFLILQHTCICHYIHHSKCIHVLPMCCLEEERGRM